MTETAAAQSEVPSRRPGRTAWAALLLGSSLAGLAIGGLAFQLARAGISPLGLFSLAIGIACGAVTGGLARWLGVVRAPALVLAVLAAVSAAVGSQHLLFFQAHVRLAGERMGRIVPEEGLPLEAVGELMRPPTAAEFFLQRDWRTRLWWAADALLTLAAAAGTAALLSRGPVCRACEVRLVAIRQGEVAGEPLRRIAGLLGRTVPPAQTTAPYRIWSCPHCGRSRCLELHFATESRAACFRLEDRIEPEVERLLGPDSEAPNREQA